MNQKPPAEEKCCHFKWRITNWKPVIIPLNFLMSSFPDPIHLNVQAQMITALNIFCLFLSLSLSWHMWSLFAACFFQCNVTCGGGDGYRVGERVCMRLFLRSAENPHPVKTGRKVDAKLCAHAKIPPAKKLVRKCKPCQFRWEVSPWSKVGSFVFVSFSELLLNLCVQCSNIAQIPCCTVKYPNSFVFLFFFHTPPCTMTITIPFHPSIHV